MAEDVSNFSSPSSHRLPTISASQALQKLSTPRKLRVPTGLPRLDEILRGFSSEAANWPDGKVPTGGLLKGQVTEIYGAPGSGKTALALQAAVGALHAGESVVWIDCSYRIPGTRVKDALSQYKLPELSPLTSSPPVAQLIDDLLKRLHHYAVPTLPHLLALICHPPTTFPPQGSSLVVIDGVSTLFASAFPDKLDNVERLGKTPEEVQWASNRRFGIMGDFLSKLNKLAAIKDFAGVLISQTSIKVKHDYGAVLRPAITSKTWADNVNNRIIVFRDFSRPQPEAAYHSWDASRFAAIAKLNGIAYSRLNEFVAFTVDKNGIHETQANVTTQSMPLMPKKSSSKLKRKRDEIADSESDDASSQAADEFDWVEDDALALDDPVEDDPAEATIATRLDEEDILAANGNVRGEKREEAEEATKADTADEGENEDEEDEEDSESFIAMELHNQAYALGDDGDSEGEDEDDSVDSGAERYNEYVASGTW